LFAWDSDSNPYIEEASAPKNSLSEFLIPAGFVQIGGTDLGGFDAICFDWSKPVQNREYSVVQVDHEDILCNSKVRVVSELWPSFIKLVQETLSTPAPTNFVGRPDLVVGGNHLNHRPSVLSEVARIC